MTRVAEVLIVSRNPTLEGLASALWSDGIAAQAVSSFEDAVRFLEFAPDCVAVLDGDLPVDLAFQVYEALHGARSVPTLLLLRDERYWKTILESQRPRIDEYAPLPIRLIEELVLRIKALLLRSGYDIASEALLAVNGASGDIELARNGRLIAVFSVKGGVGKSTIATNLATGIVQSTHQKTLLFDADLRFGDVAILMNVAPPKMLNSAWAELNEHPGLLQTSVQPHPSGVEVLARPTEAELVDVIDAQTVARTLMMFKRLYSYVVVDMHASFDELNLQILDLADQVLLVTTPDVSALSNTSAFLSTARTLSWFDKISLVVNRSNSGISLETLSGELGLEVSAAIVSGGRTVVESANRGVPILLQDPKQKRELTRNLGKIVDLVLQPAAGTVDAGGKAASATQSAGSGRPGISAR